MPDLTCFDCFDTVYDCFGLSTRILALVPVYWPSTRTRTVIKASTVIEARTRTVIEASTVIEARVPIPGAPLYSITRAPTPLTRVPTTLYPHLPYT